MTDILTGQVHRFRDKVAVYVQDEMDGVTRGKTVYISPRDAQALAAAIDQCADDITRNPNFGDSEFSTREFSPGN